MFTTDITPVKGLCGVFTDIVSKLINAAEKNKNQQPVSSKNKQKKQ